MGVLFLPAVLLVAWVLAIAGVVPFGGSDGDSFAVTAMLWMMTLPVGTQFMVSGLMHTFFARSTAQNIGWSTNGFQYEIGFVSYGIGIAGFVAAFQDAGAWLVLSVVVSVFLLGAAANHILEMVRDRNYALGNTFVLFYDIGLPVSLWALVLAGAGP
ncbi:MAG: hypothetical protein GY812_03685 [Actinomycetia bacterium]|nr:hypothetical protein [Actinomycetes bacterium]